MAESTCLHIQDRESGPIRIVEIPWISVRIGRAAFCEVRLTDPALAELACRLHRRGRTWYLTPLSAGSTIVDGEKVEVETPRPIDFDAPFRVGPYTLALKRNKFAEPDWRPLRSSPGVKPPTPRATVRPEPSSFRPAEGFTPRPVPNRPRPEPAPAGSWEARWKAAGDRLKSSSPAARPAAPTPPRSEPYAPTRPAPTPAAAPGFAPAPPSARFEPAPFVPRSAPPPTIAPTDAVGTESFGVAARAFDPAARSEERRPTGRGPVPPAPQPPPSSDVEAPGRDASEAEVGPSVFEPTSVPAAWAAEVEPAVVDERRAEDEEREEEAEQGDPTADALSMYEIDSCVDEHSLYEAEPISGAPSAAVETPTEWAFAPEPEPEPEQKAEAGADRAPSPAAIVAAEAEAGADTVRGWARREAERLDRQGREERDEAPPIERVRRREDDRRERFDPTRSPRPRDGRPPAEPALPSVQDVLTASQWTRPATPPPAAARPRPKPAPAPTTAVAPAQWSVPAWLVWPPATFLTLAVGVAFTVCSWWWAVDSRNAEVAGRTAVGLRLGTAKDRPLPLGVTPPAVSWWRSTPRHLAQWSNYLSSTRVDHGWAETPGYLIDAAAAMAPLDPLARLARARGQAGEGRPETPADALGLSRDAVSLAWTARALHKAGKDRAAVQAYRRALEIAERTEPARDEPLVFSEDPDAPRYLLPGETQAAAIVGELLSDLSWTYADWKGAIPRGSVAALVTVKGLRAQGRSEAEAALGDLAASFRPVDGAGEGVDGRPDSRRAVEHATAAEALLMRSAWKDAQLQYRAAVALMADDRIKRSWWFNLADVATRLNDENQRRIALGNVLAAVDADEVSRRAMDAQRSGPPRGRTRPDGPRAN